MTVHVHRYHDYENGRWTRVPNAALTDDRLSMGAKGVLTFLLGRPPGWSTSAERLATMSANGVHATRKFLTELVDHGYLRRITIQDEQGRPVVHHHVADQPGHLRDNPDQMSMFTEDLDPRADLVAAAVERRRRQTPSPSNTWQRTPKPARFRRSAPNRRKMTVGPREDNTKCEDKQAAPADAGPAPDAVRRAAMEKFRADLARKRGERPCPDESSTRRSRPLNVSPANAAKSTASSAVPTTCVTTDP